MRGRRGGGCARCGWLRRRVIGCLRSAEAGRWFFCANELCLGEVVVALVFLLAGGVVGRGVR